MRIDIGEALGGQRLDVVVSREAKLGRAATRRLFEDGLVHVVSSAGRRRAQKGDRAVAGTYLEIATQPSSLAGALPDPFELVVAYESPEIVIVDKPAGMPSAPIRLDERGTMANALVARYPEMANVGFSPREPGLCHRLDTDTSGLMIAARRNEAFREITEAISSGALDKRYLLICPSAPLADQGTIDTALRTRGSRVRVAEDGRPAHTRYRVMRRVGDLALVEARASPATRHQLRVHFASIGAPLLGDHTYGGDTSLLATRHALHASRLAYRGGHVVSSFAVDSALPDELAQLLA